MKTFYKHARQNGATSNQSSRCCLSKSYFSEVREILDDTFHRVGISSCTVLILGGSPLANEYVDEGLGTQFLLTTSSTILIILVCT